MEEITLNFESPHFLHSLFANDVGLLKILEKSLAVKVTTRDNWVKIKGEKDGLDKSKQFFSSLENLRRKTGVVTKHTFRYVLEVSTEKDGEGLIDKLAQTKLLGSATKPPVIPRTKAQWEYLQLMEKNDIVFGVGPAGTGKTYLAVAKGVASLKQGEVKRIILSRPAVEAGEALGFLPGDLQEKIYPYLKPLYDALYDMLEPDEIEKLIEKNLIEIAPLAYMRGRTLHSAYIILDEAQNTTCEQMFMFLTRMGERSKCVVTGDDSQIDLRKGTSSGLCEALHVLKQVEGIRLLKFQKEDVVRHQLVGEIIAAYERYRKES